MPLSSHDRRNMVGVLSVNSELLRSRAQRAMNIIARGIYAAPAGQFLYARVPVIIRIYMCTAAYRAAARARARTRSLAAQKELCM